MPVLSFTQMAFRASIHTLGCRLNQADSAHLGAELRQEGGFELVPWGEAADLLLVNSCAVTATAVQKTRQLLRAARKRAPEAYIVLCGCACGDERLLQACVAEGLADLVLPNPKPARLLPLLPERLRHEAEAAGAPARVLRRSWLPEGFRLEGVGDNPERTRANLKIQEGCDFRCTYCIVPDVRGPAVSRDLGDVLREAEALLRRGYRELVITGVNVATYANGGCDLAGLLERLLALRPAAEHGFRLRLSSTEPGPVLDRVVDLMKADSRLCRFLHLPLQYGDDGILERMGRPYDTAQYAATVRRAAEELPGVCIGTDVMVGFPGEDEAAFRRCHDFLESLPLGLMHVFSYSPRPGTPAAGWKRPPGADVARREAALLALAASKAERFLRSQVGGEAEILLEEGRPIFHGWSDNYIKVVCTDGALEGRQTGGFLRCRIDGVRDARAREVCATVIRGE